MYLKKYFASILYLTSLFIEKSRLAEITGELFQVIQPDDGFTQVIKIDNIESEKQKKEKHWEPLPQSILDNINETKITDYSILTTIQSGFAETYIWMKATNTHNATKQSVFTAVVPNSAFVTGLTLEVNGERYDSFTQKISSTYYNQCQIYKDVPYTYVKMKDSKRLISSILVEPYSIISYRLTYAEIVYKKHNKYQYSVNIMPGQILEEVQVEVKIKDNVPLKDILPELRSVNIKLANKPLPHRNIEVLKVNSSFSVVRFIPNFREQQTLICNGMSADTIFDGLSGQLLVTYDIERPLSEDKGGVIMVDGCYFVTRLSPQGLTKPLPKHVIFLMDSSRSMNHTIDELKKAMYGMLDLLDEEDIFDIIDYNTQPFVWGEAYPIFDNLLVTSRINNVLSTNMAKIPDMKAVPENIEKAKKLIENFVLEGSTNTLKGLEAALFLAGLRAEQYKDYAPMIILISSGPVEDYKTSTYSFNYNAEELFRIITYNQLHLKVPVYAVSFATTDNAEVMKRIGLKNYGGHKIVYPDEDPSIQLVDYFKSLSKPMLQGVYIRMTLGLVLNPTFSYYFNGTDIVFSDYSCSMKFEFSRNFIRVIGRAVDGWKYYTLELVAPSADIVEKIYSHAKVKRLYREEVVWGLGRSLEIRHASADYSMLTEAHSLVMKTPTDNCVVKFDDAYYGVAAKEPSELEQCIGLNE